MKNLKKLSREKLVSINGGIEVCIQNCLPGYRKCCIPRQPYYCLSVNEICV
ncbi:bacteriocin-like protein [Chryseobacterium carnipullorum]|uniref:bacteriocin-like protein n=1 Tax=Chryseobacterium carnipullorum TaxID=1124835 RepID=UPI0013DE66DB|nr:hypothetical protein [Chryseobacterium carnipullorum]